MRETLRPGIFSGLVLLATVACQSGCTTALSTAYLREGLWDTADAAAESPPTTPSTGDEPADPPADPAPDPAVDSERREAALEEALSRLTRMGQLDPAVEAALVATLQRTQPEDWPVVVEEFVASLPAREPPVPAAAEAIAVDSQASAAEAEPAAAEQTVVENTLRETRADPDPAADSPSPEPTNAEPLAAIDPPDPPATDTPPAASPPAESRLAVRSACFASAVRAWGDLDRFAADRFRPGQELIVYVELDQLAAQPSPGGHTTCIAAALRLLADDRTLHTWSFEPIAETCPSQRRDYFARFVVRIPESIEPADCRIEIAVTDTLTGTTADATLPLAIVAAE